MYRVLFRRWGRQHWWPAGSRFEVIVGAYLTQNTAWTNVERALTALRAAGLLNLTGIRGVPLPELEQHIRSAGYFRQKAKRLKTFVEFLDARYGGSLDRMFARPTKQLRDELLSLNGVGPETADSILLYAGNHASFVVDTYTRRILERHEMIAPEAAYEHIQHLFEQALVDQQFQEECAVDVQGFASGAVRPKARAEGSCHEPSRASTMARPTIVQIYNEMHGLLVGVGKNYCVKSEPRCRECPLGPMLAKESPHKRKRQ